MTLEEKIKFINSEKEKNYLYISPKTIHGGANLVRDYDTLAQYENMDKNTESFAERSIANLRVSSNNDKKNVSMDLKLYLIFCGNFKDLPDDLGSLDEFAFKYRDKIVAVYRYVESVEKKHFFIGFEQSEFIHHYGYTYLNFAELLRIFEENNVKCEIDTTIDRNIPSIYRDDDVTKFKISYNPKKEIKSEKEYQLKKVRKEV